MSHSTLRRRYRIHKRGLCFLGLLGIACLQVFSQDAIRPEDAAAAAKVWGLHFTEAELKQMVRGLNENRKGLEDLRRVELPNSLAPALVFDPRPAGFSMPTAAPAMKWELPRWKTAAPDPREWHTLGVSDLAALLRGRLVTSEQITRHCLERLKQWGPGLHCVVCLTEERAIRAARQADLEIRNGRWRGPLHGIPYGVKDLLDVQGVASTWGVSIRTNQVANSDSAVVRRLEAAGAVLVAKLSLGELAMGDVWYGGLTRNPWKPETGSSGSSAGSASAVAAGLLPFAIGSETLGSIVSPATVCGVTGLRPTFGRVSRAGAMMLSPSMDKLGPLARSARDCALVLDVIRGVDAGDRSGIEAPFTQPRGAAVKRLRIGFLEKDFQGSYDNRTNDLRALEQLRSLGWTLHPVTLPRHPKGVLYGLLSAEAAMSFDDLTRSNLDDTLVQQEAWSWPNAFRTARFISAVDYLQANRVRTRLMEDFQKIFQTVDVLVAPSWSGNQLLYSNMTGHPCVVVPDGDMGEAHPPSLCFLSGLFREGDALAVAELYQSVTGWHRQRPDLSKSR